MLYRLKESPEDFIVHEQFSTTRIDYTPTREHDAQSGQDIFLCIYFEKYNKNSMDVVLQLCERMGIMKKYVGIAGLKDKIAITRQWISIPLSAVTMVGGVEKTLTLFGEIEGVHILKTKRAVNTIRVGDNQGNSFHLVIRAQKEISSAIVAKLYERLKLIKTHGFPNYYGMQRFGKGLKNLTRAKKVIDEGAFWPGEYVSKFVLQSYANYYFNQYVHTRRESKQYVLVGDILVDGNHHNQTRIAYYVGNNQVMLIDRDRYESEQKKHIKHDITHYASHKESFGSLQELEKTRQVTGPLVGAHGLIPPEGSPCFEQENELYTRLNFWHKKVANCQHFGMLGRRRPLRVLPKHFSSSIDHDGHIHLSFDLPTGSYATVLAGALFEGIDERTMIGNRLIIPH